MIHSWCPPVKRMIDKHGWEERDFEKSEMAIEKYTWRLPRDGWLTFCARIYANNDGELNVSELRLCHCVELSNPCVVEGDKSGVLVS